MSLLEIRDLRAELKGPQGVARVLDGVDLSLGEGESVGLVGESGSGKTMLALAILGLLPEENGGFLSGSSIHFRNGELVGLDRTRLREIRGGEIAMIFQEPMTSLNPVFTIGNQIQETVELHRSLTGEAARTETLRLLDEVGIPDPQLRVKDYPHEFSGGMRQRVMVAMALAGEPGLLIADEPTTALDVTMEAQILQLLKSVQDRLGMGLLLISHDLGVVSRVCDRIVILYGGRVMEEGPTEDVLANPKHPYTRGLLGSRLSILDRRKNLRPIPGDAPEAANWPTGCRFHPRCTEILSRCRRELPPLVSVGEEAVQSRIVRKASCWLHLDDGEKR